MREVNCLSKTGAILWLWVSVLFFVVAGNMLVGRGLDTFAGEGFEKEETLRGVLLVRARHDCVYPHSFVGGVDIFVYLVVEGVYV